MLIKFYFFYIVVAINQIHVKTSDIIENDLIKSYIEKQTAPVRVILFTCSKKQTIYNLVNSLAKCNILANVITNISKFTNPPKGNTLIVSDVDCEYFSKLLEKASDFNLFKIPFKWLIFGTQVSSIPSNTKLLIDSNFALATATEQNTFHLNLLYKFTEKDTNFNYNDLGVFSRGTFTYYNSFLVSQNRSNLMCSPLTISYVLTNPNYTLDLADYRQAHVADYTKLSYIIVFNMLETLNCTKIFIQRDTWGYKPANSTYYDGGMFGDLQNGTAEIAGTASSYASSRFDIIQYVGVTAPSEVKIILKAPHLSYVSNVFTLPFDVKVWYGLYLVTGLSILILYTIAIYEDKHERFFQEKTNISEIKPKFFDVIVVQIGGITQQGSHNEPKSSSGRIALFVIFLNLMFLYTAYSANIVVLLQSSSKNVRTVQDLLTSKIELGSEDTVSNRFMFKLQNEPIRKAIYETKIITRNGQKENFMSIEKGLKKVHNEFFGFNAETSPCYKMVMDTFQEHEKCGLIEIDYFNMFLPDLSVRKESPYKKIIKVGLRRVIESGVARRHVNRIYYKKPQCFSQGSTSTSVGLVEAYFPCVIFVTGMIFSFFILLAEICYKIYYQRVNFKLFKNVFHW